MSMGSMFTASSCVANWGPAVKINLLLDKSQIYGFFYLSLNKETSGHGKASAVTSVIFVKIALD